MVNVLQINAIMSVCYRSRKGGGVTSVLKTLLRALTITTSHAYHQLVVQADLHTNTKNVFEAHCLTFLGPDPLRRRFQKVNFYIANNPNNRHCPDHGPKYLQPLISISLEGIVAAVFQRNKQIDCRFQISRSKEKNDY
uniref:Uncharacterized protein n=1 Tax=Glossina austeni TaxID=7395 RepID=A0A1A9UPV4_GLOAU